MRTLVKYTWVLIFLFLAKGMVMAIPIRETNQKAKETHPKEIFLKQVDKLDEILMLVELNLRSGKLHYRPTAQMQLRQYQKELGRLMEMVPPGYTSVADSILDLTQLTLHDADTVNTARGLMLALKLHYEVRYYQKAENYVKAAAMQELYDWLLPAIVKSRPDQTYAVTAAISNLFTRKIKSWQRMRLDRPKRLRQLRHNIQAENTAIEKMFAQMEQALVDRTLILETLIIEKSIEDKKKAESSVGPRIALPIRPEGEEIFQLRQELFRARDYRRVYDGIQNEFRGKNKQTKIKLKELKSLAKKLPEREWKYELILSEYLKWLKKKADDLRVNFIRYQRENKSKLRELRNMLD